MTIELSPDLERIVSEKVATGRYANADEFIREAIFLAAETDRIKRERLHKAIAVGMEQANRGEFSGRTIQDIIIAKESQTYGSSDGKL